MFLQQYQVLSYSQFTYCLNDKLDQEKINIFCILYKMRNTYCFIRYVQNGKLAFQGGGYTDNAWILEKIIVCSFKNMYLLITIRLKIAICKSYKNENTQFIKNITYCMIRTRTAFYRTKLDSSFFFDIYKATWPNSWNQTGFHYNTLSQVSGSTNYVL